mmetsp:Transcript_5967/g.11158  ORF Transcript_5967/g.11158 Transcript_5967/m.11158 type:complete len:208 (-) Transcript_5967:21-644(-)
MRLPARALSAWMEAAAARRRLRRLLARALGRRHARLARWSLGRWYQVHQQAQCERRAVSLEAMLAHVETQGLCAHEAHGLLRRKQTAFSRWAGHLAGARGWRRTLDRARRFERARTALLLTRSLLRWREIVDWHWSRPCSAADSPLPLRANQDPRGKEWYREGMEVMLASLTELALQVAAQEGDTVPVGEVLHPLNRILNIGESYIV